MLCASWCAFSFQPVGDSSERKIDDQCGDRGSFIGSGRGTKENKGLDWEHDQAKNHHAEAAAAGYCFCGVQVENHPAEEENDFEREGKCRIVPESETYLEGIIVERQIGAMDEPVITQ